MPPPLALWSSPDTPAVATASLASLAVRPPFNLVGYAPVRCSCCCHWLQLHQLALQLLICYWAPQDKWSDSPLSRHCIMAAYGLGSRWLDMQNIEYWKNYSRHLLIHRALRLKIAGLEYVLWKKCQLKTVKLQMKMFDYHLPPSSALHLQINMSWHLKPWTS